MLEEAMLEEAMLKEAMLEEAMLEEAMLKEAILEEAIRNNEVDMVVIGFHHNIHYHYLPHRRSCQFSRTRGPTRDELLNPPNRGLIGSGN